MVYWTYEQDLIILDESLSDKEKQKLLKGKMVKERKRYLQKLKITKDKLDKEKQQYIDIYPDYTMAQIQMHLHKPIHYVRSRIHDLRRLGLLREEPILTKKQKDYIALYASKNKAQDLAEDLNLPINLVKMAISEEYRKGNIKNKPKITDSMPLKMFLRECNRPPNAIDKRKIRHKKYKDNQMYEVTKATKKKGDPWEIFKGTLVYQNEEFVLLKHSEHGYKESFRKIDFETGEFEIKEVTR